MLMLTSHKIALYINLHYTVYILLTDIVYLEVLLCVAVFIR